MAIQQRPTAKTTTPQQTAAPAAPIPKKTVMPVPLVIVSGFCSIALLIWCLLWCVMLVMVDSTRATVALTTHPIVFLIVMLGCFGGLLYTQYTIAKSNFVFDPRDHALIALARFVGCVAALVIFRVYFYGTLTADDIREILPIEEVKNMYDQY